MKKEKYDKYGIIPLDKGHRRIKEAANYAIHEWWYSGIEVGSYFSKRGKRTHRGREIN